MTERQSDLGAFIGAEIRGSDQHTFHQKHAEKQELGGQDREAFPATICNQELF